MEAVVIEAGRYQGFKGQSHSREGCCLETWRLQNLYQLGVPGNHPVSKDTTTIPVSGIILEAGNWESVDPSSSLTMPHREHMYISTNPM